MKKTLYCLLLPLLVAACAQHGPDTVELTEWQFSWHDQWYPATVPGFIHTDLMANGLIEDPYYGTNEEAAQWVCDNREWHYRYTIDRSRLPKGDSLWVVFEGLAGRVVIEGLEHEGDTILCSNSEYADNMFSAYCFHLPEQATEIHLFFLPLADSIAESHYGIALPDRRAFTRIAPYQQGWDWGPKLLTCGIWKPVYVTNRRPHLVDIPDAASIERLPVELRQEADSIGQSFTFYRYGKPIFAKGANWIPVHSFPIDDAANRARYRQLLTSAREAGFNMIRIWGGGIYEHDYFYDLCDSLGLMVWQDFNFSTMLYPDNSAMLESIREEARQNVARIARHQCVVLWCGNNEVKNGWEDWGWQGVYHWTPEQRARLQHGIDTIFGNDGILAQAVRDCDPLHRPYIATSPLYGWGHPECTTHGDSHYWGVWWGEMPFEVYREKTGRFMSEYGFQSYPLLSTIVRYAPEVAERPTESFATASERIPALASHQKHARGLQIIDKAMRQYYGHDSRTLTVADYAYVSQLLQAWGTGYGILCHLSDPRCDGTLYWQLNDCWPVASWSSIDYYGNWKALHYRAQALFADSVDLGQWAAYYSVYPKDRTYPEPRFAVSTTLGGKQPTLTVTLTAETDLYDTYIDTDPHIDGHFSHNFVDLKAGQSITTTFIPVDPKADLRGVKITVRTLNEVMNRPRGREK